MGLAGRAATAVMMMPPTTAWDVVAGYLGPLGNLTWML